MAVRMNVKEVNWMLFIEESKVFDLQRQGIQVTLDEVLKPWNGRDIPDSYHIEFETEEDVVFFKLRWR